VFVAGVDGCRGGWVVALHDLGTRTLTLRVLPRFADVLSLSEAPIVLAIDMPVGLLDAAVAGGRACDREARALLGSPRCSSVLTPPVRAALAAHTHAAALVGNRASDPFRIGISLQAFVILRS
jgi:predicted RNase H-like nuclease